MNQDEKVCFALVRAEFLIYDLIEAMPLMNMHVGTREVLFELNEEQIKKEICNKTLQWIKHNNWIPSKDIISEAKFKKEIEEIYSRQRGIPKHPSQLKLSEM